MGVVAASMGALFLVWGTPPTFRRMWLVGGGTAYTLLTQPGARVPMAIRVRSRQDQILGSVLGPKLWVVRIR